MSLLATVNARGVVASRPAAAAANEGYLYFGTDTGILYRSNGSSWDTNSAGFTNPMTTAGDTIYGGASGLPTRLAGGTSTYVLTSNGTTSAPSWQAGGGAGSDLVQVASGAGSVRIPGLAGSPDIPLGGGNDDEFDVTDTSDPMTGWTTLGTVTSHNINSTVKSHYRLSKAAVSGVDWSGIYKACPSMPFTVTAKMTGVIGRDTWNSAGLMIATATPGALETLTGRHSGTNTVRFEHDSWTGPTGTGAGITIGGTATWPLPPAYLRCVVTSSTALQYYVSLNGSIWAPFGGSRNPGFTVGSVGLVAECENATYGVEAIFDWIRFT